MNLERKVKKKTFKLKPGVVEHCARMREIYDVAIAAEL